ncbi:MAG: hypothetical protein AB7O56_00170 [Bauldia sp.]
MQTFINAVAGRLGVSTATATTAVGSLLSLIERNADKPSVAALFAALPHARTLASDADHETAEAGLDPKDTLYATLAARTGTVNGVGLAGLAASGLSAGQIGTMTTMFLDHARTVAPAPVVDGIIGSVPGLAKLRS